VGKTSNAALLFRVFGASTPEKVALSISAPGVFFVAVKTAATRLFHDLLFQLLNLFSQSDECTVSARSRSR